MAASTASLRALGNQLIMGKGRLPEYNFGMPVQSNLEKYARAMRYATKTVQYYSPRYNYYYVQQEMNEEAKKLFDGENGLGQ